MDARVKAAIRLMNESLGAQFSMRDLAAKVNLAPARLRQLFKHETGRAPVQYRRDLRMRHAQELLRNTFLSIKEVAFLSGANDLSHFVRDFKKYCGKTPCAFRTSEAGTKKL